MLTIDCPPIYDENTQEYNSDDYFVKLFKSSRLNEKMISLTEQIIHELEAGSGCVILKNSYSGENINRAKAVLINVCRHIGWPVSQTPAPNFLEEITFKAPNNLSTKAGYRSRASLPLHTDRCDLNVIFCFSQANSGGNTRVVSSVKLYEQIMSSAPRTMLDVLESNFPFSRHGENTENEECFYLSKIFHQASCISGFAAHYIRCFIEDKEIQKHYPLSKPMIDFLDTIDEKANFPDIGFNIRLKKGDILILNSHTTLHSREEYDDCESSRHLLRMWLSHPFSRALPQDFLHKFKKVTPGSYRGGIWANDDMRLFYEKQFLFT